MVLINKFASPNKDIITKPNNCKKCNIKLNTDNRVRKSGHVGYSNICRACTNKNGLKYTRKRRQIIKDNPLW